MLLMQRKAVKNKFYLKFKGSLQYSLCLAKYFNIKNILPKLDYLFVYLKLPIEIVKIALNYIEHYIPAYACLRGNNTRRMKT